MTSCTQRHFGLALFGALVAGCGGEEKPVRVITPETATRKDLGKEVDESKTRKKAQTGKTRG